MKFPVFVAIVILMSATTQAYSAPLTIHNDSLRVSYDEASGSFTLERTTPANLFTITGTLGSVPGQALVETVTDKVFGNGQAVVVTNAGGSAGEIMVFPHLPFALLRITMTNGGTEPETLNHVSVAMLRLTSTPPVQNLKTLGTGGLNAPQDHQGSYAWLAVADPQSRSGVVAGWLTGERASGVLLPKVDGDAVTITARGDYGRLLLAPKQSAESETLAVGAFDDARLGLEAWAGAVARQLDIHLPPQPTGFCTWYTEKHGGSSDEKSLASLTEFAAKNLKPYGFNFVQIDDGWQRGDSKGNGPNKNFTDYRLDGPYSSGMKSTADDIKAHGLIPGIWFMPFAGTENDPWFADKQSLFVKTPDGKPYTTNWGGTSLDMTNPTAQAYLRSVVTRIAHDWGFEYFKMDGLYTGAGIQQEYVNQGYKDDDIGTAVFSNPTKTNIEAFRDGLRLVRDAAGPGVFFLGCTAAQNMRSYQGSFGLVNAMRVGPDNDGSWGGWMGHSPATESHNYFLNGRIWYNDPDPFYVRASLDLDEARTTASFAAVTGCLTSNSDWIPDLPAERLDIIRRTMPSHGKTARPVDLFENDPPRIWTVTDTTKKTRRDVVALFNWSDSTTDVTTPVDRLGIAPAQDYVGFDYWANAFIAPFQGTLTASLPAHGCKVIAVRPMLDRPFLLSTSRHITQGMTDVIAEGWSSNVLFGKSRVVGGDAYELRVYAPTAPHTWTVSEVGVGAADKAAGAAISYTQSGAEVRVKITSPQSRETNWKVVFK